MWTSKEGGAVLYTAVQEIPATPWMVDRILNRDLFGDFCGLKIIMQTISGNSYEIDLLKGGPVPIEPRGKGTLLRRVNYRRIDRRDDSLGLKNQFVRFSVLNVPKVEFFSSLLEDENPENTTMDLRPGPLKPEMTLVIDWNKLVA
jgi:hypothetical protein